jgi:hypothetical protein
MESHLYKYNVSNTVLSHDHEAYSIFVELLVVLFNTFKSLSCLISNKI